MDTAKRSYSDEYVDLYTGLGKHIILSSQISTFAKVNLLFLRDIIRILTDANWDAQSITATQILYITSLIPLKLSIIFFYRRLSTAAPHSITLWVLGIWVVVMGVAGDLTAIFSCAEVPTINVGAHCVNYEVATFVHGGQDVLMNLVLLCWPMPFLWGTKMDRIRKFHLIGVFALGGL